jgi:hypothetical protein
MEFSSTGSQTVAIVLTYEVYSIDCPAAKLKRVEQKCQNPRRSAATGSTFHFCQKFRVILCCARLWRLRLIVPPEKANAPCLPEKANILCPRCCRGKGAYGSTPAEAQQDF